MSNQPEAPCNGEAKQSFNDEKEVYIPVGRPSSRVLLPEAEAEKELPTEDPGKYVLWDQGPEPHLQDDKQALPRSNVAALDAAEDSTVVELEEQGSEGHGQRFLARWQATKIAVIAIVVIAILLAVVLGAVLGTKHTRESKNDQPAPAGMAGPAQIASTSGAWNKTGLFLFNAFTARDGWYPNLLAYQSFDGQLMILPVNISANASMVDANSSVRVGEPFAISGISIANGSSLTGYTADWEGGEGYRLIYTSANGTLSDLNATAADIHTWTSGGLSTLGARAPTSQRTQMALTYNYCFGANSTFQAGPLAGGSRLWATDSSDGQIHQYDCNGSATETWSDHGVVVPNALSGGALAFTQLAQDPHSCNSEWVLFSSAGLNSTDPISGAGTTSPLMYQTSNLTAGNATDWPTGPAWTKQLHSIGSNSNSSDVQISPPSEISLAFRSNTSLLLFYEQDTTLKILDVGLLQPSLAPTALQVMPGVSVMAGSALTGAFQRNNDGEVGPYLLFFQRNESAVDWWFMSADGERQGTGNAVS